MVTYKGIPIRLSTGFSAETLQAREEWKDILKILKDKNCQFRLLYKARSTFGYEEEIRLSQTKLREFITTKPALQEILKGALLPETKVKNIENFDQGDGQNQKPQLKIRICC